MPFPPFFPLNDFTVTLEEREEGKKQCSPDFFLPPHFLFLILLWAHIVPGPFLVTSCVLSLSPPSPARCLCLQISFTEVTKVVVRYPLRSLAGWVQSCEW